MTKLKRKYRWVVHTSSEKKMEYITYSRYSKADAFKFFTSALLHDVISWTIIRRARSGEESGWRKRRK
jgi:hypothetical protein